MFFVVVINCWFSSKSDDRIAVSLENAPDKDTAKSQALSRLGIGSDQIFDVSIKLVNDANVGLIFMED